MGGEETVLFRKGEEGKSIFVERGKEQI